MTRGGFNESLGDHPTGLPQSFGFGSIWRGDIERGINHPTPRMGEGSAVAGSKLFRRNDLVTLNMFAYFTGALRASLGNIGRSDQVSKMFVPSVCFGTLHKVLGSESCLVGHLCALNNMLRSHPSLMCHPRPIQSMLWRDARLLRVAGSSHHVFGAQA